MARRGRPISRLYLLRLWIQRFAFVLLLGASLALLAFGRAESPWASQLRAGVTDAVAPVASILSIPLRAVADWYGAMQDGETLRRENAELKAELLRLRLRNTELEQAGIENEQLRRLANAKVPIPGKHIVARVLADPGGPYVRSFLVSAGARDGVKKGLAVMVPEGLVGRVVDVGRTTARVMLLTDLNARTPVMVLENGERAVLAGANADLPRLMFLPRTVEPKVGQRLVTSGLDGVFPPGIPVGEIAELGERGPRVRPYVNWNSVLMVRILDHATPGLLDPASGAPAPGTPAPGTPAPGAPAPGAGSPAGPPVGPPPPLPRRRPVPAEGGAP
jgi:rod shape-determining protein MreC